VLEGEEQVDLPESGLLFSAWASLRSRVTITGRELQGLLAGRIELLPGRGTVLRSRHLAWCTLLWSVGKLSVLERHVET